MFPCFSAGCGCAPVTFETKVACHTSSSSSLACESGALGTLRLSIKTELPADALSESRYIFKFGAAPLCRGIHTSTPKIAPCSPSSNLSRTSGVIHEGGVFQRLPSVLLLDLTRRSRVTSFGVSFPEIDPRPVSELTVTGLCKTQF